MHKNVALYIFLSSICDISYFAKATSKRVNRVHRHSAHFTSYRMQSLQTVLLDQSIERFACSKPHKLGLKFMTLQY